MMSSEKELLRILADMPFLDRLEATAVSGWSRGAVYEAVRRLEDAGLAASVPHATNLTPHTRRFHLTAAGLRQLAKEERIPTDDLLRSRPASAQSHRLLLERLDAVAVVYRLADAISDLAHPIRFRWYRAMPADAAIALPDGRTIAVVRQGHATDRSGFAKRLWRLEKGPRFGGVLLVVPDETRLRHARRLLARTRANAALAIERDAAAGSIADPVWRLPSIDAAIDLRTAVDRADPRGAFPMEQPLARVAMPTDLPLDARGRSVPDHVLPVLLKPIEKRALDLIADWPWIAVDDLAELLGLARNRTYQVAAALHSLGLVTRIPDAQRRLAPADRGLAVLARRDRASVGAARKRWSAAPGGGDWRGVSGRRSRQLLRNLEHTAAVHGFMAALASQARAKGWRTDQLDPPRVASRFFHHFGRVRSVQPDAFAVLRRGDAVRPFFLEWERRAVRPVTMAARLAPYLRYYASSRPIDDHGSPPLVLVAFDDESAQGHFLRIAREEMARAGRVVPLLASNRLLLERSGPLGRAWFAPGDFQPISVLPEA